MRLMTYTDYALRVLLYVTARPGGPVSASAIGAAYGISVDHVSKATKALTRAGILRATRGASGGVELARPAVELRLGAIVRLFEGEAELVDCSGKRGSPCKIAPGCRLRRVLERAERAFFAELDRYTLADLVDQPQLVRLLRMRGEA